MELGATHRSSQSLRDEDRRIPQARWSASLAELVRSGFNKEIILKLTVEGDRERHLMSTDGLYLHSLVCALGHINKHTCAHTHTYMFTERKIEGPESKIESGNSKQRVETQA